MVRDHPLPPLRFYLTMHRDLRRVPRVRALATTIQEMFVDYMVEQAAAEARFQAGTKNRSRSRP